MYLLAVVFLSVKIGGSEFVPKELIFAAPDPRSMATADGKLPDECKWEYQSETRVARRDDEKNCVRYYYKTTIRLTQVCARATEQAKTVSSERITSTGPHCPDSHGRVPPPKLEARALSSGKTSDGRRQEIVLQPDGTRIVITYTEAVVSVGVTYPDGSADALSLPVK